MPDVVTALGGGGRIPVPATFDGIKCTGSIVSMVGGPCLGMLKATRERLGKGPGDTVVVTVRRDTAERTAEMPEEPAAAMAAAGARTAVGVIESAERPRTRARRIDEAVAATG
nr:DUF1905 domain-containing protein [Nocardia lijiangensis]